MRLLLVMSALALHRFKKAAMQTRYSSCRASSNDVSLRKRPTRLHVSDNIRNHLDVFQSRMASNSLVGLHLPPPHLANRDGETRKSSGMLGRILRTYGHRHMFIVYFMNDHGKYRIYSTYVRQPGRPDFQVDVRPSCNCISGSDSSRPSDCPHGFSKL